MGDPGPQVGTRRSAISQEARVEVPPTNAEALARAQGLVGALAGQTLLQGEAGTCPPRPLPAVALPHSRLATQHLGSCGPSPL